MLLSSVDWVRIRGLRIGSTEHHFTVRGATR